MVISYNYFDPLARRSRVSIARAGKRNALNDITVLGLATEADPATGYLTEALMASRDFLAERAPKVVAPK